MIRGLVAAVVPLALTAALLLTARTENQRRLSSTFAHPPQPKETRRMVAPLADYESDACPCQDCSYGRPQWPRHEIKRRDVRKVAGAIGPALPECFHPVDQPLPVRFLDVLDQLQETLG